MGTIAAVTEDVGAAGTLGEEPAPVGGALPGRGHDGQAPRSQVARERRSLVVPLLSAVVTALIGGVLLLAVVGFNTLRGDIAALDSKIDVLDGKIDSEAGALDGKIDSKSGALDGKIDSKIDALDGKIDSKIDALDSKIESEIAMLRSDLGAEISALRSDMNEGFAQVHAVLLDHTDRLARLEAIHAVHSHVPQ